MWSRTAITSRVRDLLAPRDNSPVSGGRRLTRGLLFIYGHPVMVAWAKAAGREIFDWDEEMRVSSAPPGEQEGYLFIKKFFPELATAI